MNYAKFIDHTLLKATANEQDIQQICDEALQYQFASVCIQPTWVAFAKNVLQNTAIKICTVVGFPLGANTTASKVFETQDAIKNGADEIDMVINIGAVKSNKWKLVSTEIEQIVVAASPKIVKVIIETCYLTEIEKVKICNIAIHAGALFIKTSTGFGTAGAVLEDIVLMKEIAGTKGVKASGGIKNNDDAQAMIQAGATRIGTSNGIAIITHSKDKNNSSY